MKKEKWTTDLSSVEAKRRNLARPELSENAVLFSTDLLRIYFTFNVVKFQPMTIVFCILEDWILWQTIINT
jgi:hypothetical protein